MKKALIIALSLIILTVLTAFAVSATEVDIWDGTVATGFESGSGTEADPYIIKTPEQLAYLASSVNAGTQYNGKFFKLANDIYLNDTTDWKNWDTTAPANTWTAIGTYNSFSDNKPFSGIFNGDHHAVYGVYIKNTIDYQGLFGYVEGEIENLGIEESYIRGRSYVGGVCGHVDDGTITNCYNAGKVSGSRNRIGGVCGYNYFGGTITSCYNVGTVAGDYCKTGGVCGNNSGTITDCHNKGTVIGVEEVGGISGDNTGGEITDCYNIGAVIGTSYGVGGVCGYGQKATITNCHNTGTVISYEICAGGISGYFNQGEITDCYNTGTVSGYGTYGVGGVCGQFVDGTITNCYNTGAVNGNSTVGGVCGYNYGTVTNCYNVGDICGNSDMVGGVCGKNGNEYIDKTIANCYNIGTVSGNSTVGGVCGYNSGTITNCYYLTGSATDGDSIVQFGIGNETKGSTTADVSGSTTGLTDAEIKKQQSFVGFDFDTTWVMISDYPLLRCFVSASTPLDSAEYFATLALDVNLDVYLTISNIGDGFVYDNFAVYVDGNKSETVFKKDNNTNSYNGVLFSSSPVDISKTHDIVVKYNGDEKKSFTYSVESYCNAVLDSDQYGPSSDLGKLCAAVLKYGQYAKDYAEEKTDSTDATLAGVFGSYQPVRETVTKTKKAYGASAALEINDKGEITLVYRVYTELAGLTFYVLNDDVKPAKITPSLVSTSYEKDNQCYVIKVGALPMYRLSRYFTLRMDGVDSTDFKVKFGVFSYCKLVQDLSDGPDDPPTYTDTLKTLCQAIYAYGVAATASDVYKK